MIVPSQYEIKENSRARSAKLRIGEKFMINNKENLSTLSSILKGEFIIEKNNVRLILFYFCW